MTAVKDSISWYEPFAARRVRPVRPLSLADFLGKRPIATVALIVLAYIFALLFFVVMRSHLDLKTVSIVMGIFIGVILLIVVIVGVIGYYVPIWVRIDAKNIRFVEMRNKTEIVELAQVRRAAVFADPSGMNWVNFEWVGGEKKICLAKSTKLQDLAQFLPKGVWDGVSFDSR